ncbi:TVP38/TMEM64 family protein [Algiphilus aromaticivorans]|uniref:TVP38/TMEM64 family protein n=1 Tax=Algiphilus aromaticivorans TaxID=382454 RepID=UPI0005C2280B|nr:VTT domain-containing protein [Algiphilus aromaticivorans]
MTALPDRKWLGLAALTVLLLGLTGLWQWTPLGEWANSEKLSGELEALARSPWAPVTLGLVYLAAAPVMFPVMALNLALILAMGPFWGIGYALYGSLLAGLAAFWAGHSLGQRALARLRSDTVDKALRVVRVGGLPGLILLRIVPLAPYPVVNVVLGAGGIGTGVFVTGTLIGVLPSLILMGVVGFQLRQVLQDPNAGGITVLVGLALGCVALAAWLHRRLSARLADS